MNYPRIIAVSSCTLHKIMTFSSTLLVQEAFRRILHFISERIRQNSSLF